MTTPGTQQKNPAASATTPEPNRTVVQWRGARRFDAGRRGGPSQPIDGHGETGPSPVDTLLNALATCSAIDVIEILAKRRTPVATLEVDVAGTRATTVPRRLTHVLLTFRITGDGIEREQAERAIDLSITKYCSVRDSLDPQLPIEWTLVLNDTPRAPASD